MALKWGGGEAQRAWVPGGEMLGVPWINEASVTPREAERWVMACKEPADLDADKSLLQTPVSPSIKWAAFHACGFPTSVLGF